MSDIRFAFRRLRRAPGYALTAMGTLGLGIGAMAAVYSVIQTVLLAPLPYPQPDRLVGVALTFPHDRPNAEQTGASAEFVQQNMRAFASTSVMDDGAAAVNLSIHGHGAAQVEALRVSEGYFRTLGANPELGHTFTAAEDHPGSGHTAVLSHGLWVRQFGSDPTIVGQSIRINEESYTVIGVMPASFATTAETTQGIFGSPDLWTPLQLSAKDPGYDGDNYQMIARLRSDVSLAAAQQELAALTQPFYAKYPEYRKWFDPAHQTHELRLWTLQDVLVSRARRSLLIVFGAVVAVLLVACLNLAGLMIARSLRRVREVAVRSALGATRTHLVRLLLSEGLLLAAGSAVLGIVVARLCGGILLHASPLALPALRAAVPAASLAGAVVVLTVAVTSVLSLAPLLFVYRSGSRSTRLGGPSLGETLSHARLSRTLLITQVGLAMVLLTAASVLAGTFLRLREVPPGIEPRQVTVFQVALKGTPYANTQHTAQFVAAVLERLQAIPGVERAAAINGLPLDRGLNMGGYPANAQDRHGVVEFRSITPGYFRTMGIPVLAGRDIAGSDNARADRVILISAAAARKYWPGRSAIGESFRVGNETNWRIIGVVGDAQQHSLVSTGDVVLYAPMTQLSDEFTGIVNGWFPTTFALRTSAHVDMAAVIQRAVSDADPQIPIARMSTMQAVIETTLQQPRFFSVLASSFSLFALVLTIIGLFGLLSYQVTQRTREIGVRMAMGADRYSILRGVLARAMAIVAAGIVLGSAGSWLVQPVLVRLLADSGIEGDAAGKFVLHMPLALCAASLSMLLAAAAASWLPARRAASVEPMQALRAE